MIDTVTKLMALADEWADECGGCDSGHLAAHSKRRQALEAELVKLFTPPKDQTFNTAAEAIAYLHGYAAAHDKYKIVGADPAIVGLAIHDAEHTIKSAAYAKWSADNATAHAAKVTEAAAKAAHGITGESK